MTQYSGAQHLYRVSSRWCGWFGGWGSEGDIARHIETMATGGYRLVRTESRLALWYWFVPRVKTLFVYERVDRETHID